MERGARLDASVGFDDLVRPFLMADGLTDALVIALERIDSDDELGLETFEFSSPTSQFAIVRRTRQEIALLKNLIAIGGDVGAESVHFHGLRRRIGETRELTPHPRRA
jgi:hypothetical protein